MKSHWKYLVVSIPILWAAALAAGCGEDDPVAPPEPPKPALLTVTVGGAPDSTRLVDANVVLYRADSREAVGRGMTDGEGTIVFQVPMGDYQLEVSAQAFEPTPPQGITPIPFYLAPGTTNSQEVLLLPLQEVADTGYVYGMLQPPLGNFLVTAEDQGSGDKYYTASGPDGVFVLYNLPFGDYSVEALKAGYQMSGPASAYLGVDAETDSVTLSVVEYAGSTLSGSITFLASENSVVDITLLDPETRAVIPGLSVKNSANNLTYRMVQIPDGDYLAWASFQNDGYVLDPDWLFKNPGGLDIGFASPGSAELDYSVTDAIILLSPTNPAESTSPALADDPVPTFSWAPYPSTKEYFIEVRDLGGRRLWGGFEADGTSNHAVIDAATTSVRYNFDEQPELPALQPGTVYQWRLWADKGTQMQGFVEQLISSSEDLRGLFRVPEAAPAP